MRHALITITLILAIPVLCHGSINPDARLGLPEFEASGWNEYHLELDRAWHDDSVVDLTLGYVPGFDLRISSVRSLNEIHGGTPYSGKPAPCDMASMVSFLWSEMLIGVDIVAEVKDFARQIRHKGRRARKGGGKRRDSRNQWKFVVSCRVDERTEVAALFVNRGRLFGEGNLVMNINAVDPMSEEIGVTMAYSGGVFNVRADRMTLTEMAEAKLMFKF